MERINTGVVKLLLLGCGNMGSALLRGGWKADCSLPTLQFWTRYPSTLVKCFKNTGSSGEPRSDCAATCCHSSCGASDDGKRNS